MKFQNREIRVLPSFTQRPPRLQMAASVPISEKRKIKLATIRDNPPVKRLQPVKQTLNEIITFSIRLPTDHTNEKNIKAQRTECQNGVQYVQNGCWPPK